jgi:hypothetical protein
VLRSEKVKHHLLKKYYRQNKSLIFAKYKEKFLYYNEENSELVKKELSRISLNLNGKVTIAQSVRPDLETTLK